LLLIFLHVSYGILVSQWAPSVWPPLLNQPIRHFYDYAGVIDVQTTKSTGGGDIQTVAKAAESVGLNFVILTDLNNFSPEIDTEKSYGPLLIFEGGKYNYLDTQLLNFDLSNKDHLEGPGRSQVVFSDLLSQPNPNHDREAGLIFLAHPFKPGYRWEGDYPPGLDGVEIYNLKGIWLETWLSSKLSFFWSLIVYPFNSNLAFVRLFTHAGAREIVLWDKLNVKQSTWAIAGADAEAHLHAWGDRYFDLPPYETLFSIVRNHVLVRSELTGSPIEDRRKISEALRNGSFYLSVDLLQDPKGFESFVSGPNNFIAPIGAQTALRPDLNLEVNLPSRPAIPFEIEIYKDGERVLTSTSPTTQFALHSPGVYRSVVRLKVPLPLPDGSQWINWILTNPIRIYDSSSDSSTGSGVRTTKPSTGSI
jgi:hypothetical protein